MHHLLIGLANRLTNWVTPQILNIFQQDTNISMYRLYYTGTIIEDKVIQIYGACDNTETRYLLVTPNVSIYILNFLQALVLYIYIKNIFYHLSVIYI